MTNRSVPLFILLPAVGFWLGVALQLNILARNIQATRVAELEFRFDGSDLIEATCKIDGRTLQVERMSAASAWDISQVSLAQWKKAPFLPPFQIGISWKTIELDVEFSGVLDNYLRVKDVILMRVKLEPKPPSEW